MLGYLGIGFVFSLSTVLVFILTAFVFYIINIGGDYTQIAVFFIGPLFGAYVSGFLAKSKKENILVGLCSLVMLYLFVAFFVLGVGDFFSDPSRTMYYIAASFFGVLFSSLALGSRNANGESSNDFNPVVITRKLVTALEDEKRDESTVSVSSHVKHQTSYVGNDSVSIPYTTISTSRNERKVQDIWFKDESGREDRLKLVNAEIGIRSGHKLSLFYSQDKYLEFLRNETTGEMVSVDNYLVDPEKLYVSNNLGSLFYLSFIGALPYLGVLGLLGSTFTTYRYLNKPMKRPYLGKFTVFAVLISTLISLLATISMKNFFQSSDLMGIVYSYATAFIVILIALSAGFSLTSEKAKSEKKRYKDYIKENFKID